MCAKPADEAVSVPAGTATVVTTSAAAAPAARSAKTLVIPTGAVIAATPVAVTSHVFAPTDASHGDPSPSRRPDDRTILIFFSLTRARETKKISAAVTCFPTSRWKIIRDGGRNHPA